MMGAKDVCWLIDGYMLDLAAERGCGSIADAARRQGMRVWVVRSEAALADRIDLPAWADRCVVTYGSFRFVRRVERQLRREGQPPLLPGAFANVDYLSYSAFGSKLGHLLLNDDFIILPFGEFRRRRLAAWGGQCFLRPNAVTKSFTGMVVNDENFDLEMNALRQLQHVRDEDLVVAASVRTILRETRFVIVDGKVISGSTYGWNGNADIGRDVDDRSLALAVQIAENPSQPDRAYTCDVALVETPDGLDARLIELNSFSCAGLYACDLDAVVVAVADAALAEWS